MSNKFQQTEAIKKILDQAKCHPSKNQEGWIKDFNFAGDLVFALHDIGEEKIYELKNEVYAYLKDVDPRIREQAVRTLGYGWGKGLHLPEFKDIAYDMWLNDPDPEVKEVAIDEWISYYYCTKDPMILKYLYNIIYSEQHTINARVVALIGFMQVADALTSSQESHDIFGLKRLYGDASEVSGLDDDYDDKVNHIKMENLRLFNQAINKGYYLNKINSIMKKYVPGWKSQII